MEPPHIVIIGAGFGGLACAKAFGRSSCRVTIVDRCNHHLFQPLLYQVATAGLAAPAIAAPTRFLLRTYRNIRTLLADVQAIEPAGRKVVLDDGSTLEYDFLVVASGATHSYFGRDEWAAHAPALKTLADAQHIRRRILQAFEFAERAATAEETRSWLRFIVIGGGPTGVELAGTLAEIARHTLPQEFRRIDSRSAEVHLIELSDRVLSAFPAALSDKARQQLQRLGVTVNTGARVTGIDADGVSLQDGSRLPSHTVIWAAGVQGSPLGRFLDAPVDRAGRVSVLPDLSLAAHPEIFVVGDLANTTSRGKPVPGVGAAAKQMGHRAACNILARMANTKAESFAYRDYGMLATIGRNAAVGTVGGLQMSGRLAWLFWLCVHLFYLIGFRNRLVVLLDWAWSYVTFERAARIFTTPDKRE
ncbi:MAG: NAD(P)/FAD-dependent oxidoreductase [Steroidobacteraceae bacterium]